MVLNDFMENKRRLHVDEERMMFLFNEHVRNFALREGLARQFSFHVLNNKEVYDAFIGTGAVKTVLRQLEGLISSEFVHIRDEATDGEKILADLKRLTARGSSEETERWNKVILDGIVSEDELRLILGKIYAVLKLELHTIRLILEGAPNQHELLGYLFRLIFHQEAYLYTTLRENELREKGLFERTMRGVRALLLRQRFKEDVETAENKAEAKVVKLMGADRPAGVVNSVLSFVTGRTALMNRYREVVERVFARLIDESGARDVNENDEELPYEKFEKMMENSQYLSQAIAQALGELHIRHTAQDIQTLARAFRKAFDEGHFENLEDDIND